MSNICTDAFVPDHNLHHHYYNSSHVISAKPSVVPATTVQRIETFSNGCYKQIVKEVDVTDIRRFVQTEEIICPPGIHFMTHQPNGTLYYTTPQNASHFLGHNITYANGTHIPVYHNSSLPFSTQHKIEPHEHHSPEWAETPDAATSEVLIISQKIGFYDKEKKTNAANNLYSVNCLVIFLTVTSAFYSFM